MASKIDVGKCPNLNVFENSALNMKNVIFAFCSIILFCALADQIHAQSKTASVALHGRSIQMFSSNTVSVIGSGAINWYFSSYVSQYSTIRVDLTTQAGSMRVSDELSPSSSPGSYWGGFAKISQANGSMLEFGSYTLAMPTQDADGNGIIDVLQNRNDGSFIATGTLYSLLGSFPAQFGFTRNAGGAFGSYVATISAANGRPQQNIAGNFRLSGYSGSVSYNRSTGNILNFTLSVLTPPGAAGSVTSLAAGGTASGSVTYTLSGTDTVNYPAFVLTATSGVKYNVKAGSLTRSGTSYRGAMILEDGYPDGTYWQDYTDYVVEISDGNDSNGNGIPDLSDSTASIAIVGNPQSHAVTTGNPVVFTVSATGAGTLSYQWKKNGVSIPGASGSTYTISSTSAVSAGSYSVDITNATGTVNSAAANLVVTSPSGSNRLSALSVRNFAGSGANTLITGVVLSGTSTRALVARGIGPNLAQYGVSGFIADPQLKVFGGAVQLDFNDNWGGSSSMAGAFASVGLAPLPSNSKDAALSRTFSPGVYTMHLTSATGDGIGLFELYDLESTNIGARMAALSVRGPVGTGAEVLIVGFVVSGSGAKQIVVRGLGPALATQGVTGYLVDPELKLFNSAGIQIDSSNDWGGNPSLSSAFFSVGLGTLPSNSKDAAFVTTLVPGTYTIQLSGVNSTTGVGLIELYEM
jgi:hypothetical protein